MPYETSSRNEAMMAFATSGSIFLPMNGIDTQHHLHPRQLLRRIKIIPRTIQFHSNPNTATILTDSDIQAPNKHRIEFFL